MCLFIHSANTVAVLSTDDLLVRYAVEMLTWLEFTVSSGHMVTHL